MSQDINSIIKQLAEIDSASAKILQKTQDEKAQYALKQCRIDCDNDIEQLNRIYNENSAKWVDDIFNEIIKE